MMREMGAMMTGIIMAGRTGAAFAARLGTMKVTQEVDALTTAGFSPLEFLVLPRVMALILMMPLLCLYSDFVGVLGGAVIGVGMLVALLVDATIVRALLVPATMKLLGSRNWYLPKGLRWLPKFEHEPQVVPAAA